MDRKRVLVVEDDPATREAMGLGLATLGYRVDAAANGREALQHLRGGDRPALILLDLLMPVMDGWQFRREQQQDPALAAIPVVLVSADTGLPEQSRQLRAAGYLQKPVDFDDLVVAVARHSRGRDDCPGQGEPGRERHTPATVCWLRSVAEIAGLIERVVAAMAAEGYSDRDRFGVRLALEEALVNAVKHGNRGNLSKQVRVSYQVTGQFTRVEVEDEGLGFDPQGVADPTAPENRERSGGRGLLLMRAYLTSCCFNERGNRVILLKDRFPLSVEAGG